MTDGPLSRLLKLLVRLPWAAELHLRRALGRLHERPRWRLEGGCTGCGRCCEEPSLAVAPLLLRLPTFRAALVWWQLRVNGFELVAEDRRAGALAFRCSHFDPASRRCDSHRSRPGICRDYPRVQLDQAWPELFPECGFRVKAVGAEALLEGIESSALPAEKKAELRRRLRID